MPHLVVTFTRKASEPVSVHINDSESAMCQALCLIARQPGGLVVGDVLRVIDGDEGPNLPESH